MDSMLVSGPENTDAILNYKGSFRSPDANNNKGCGFVLRSEVSTDLWWSLTKLESPRKQRAMAGPGTEAIPSIKGMSGGVVIPMKAEGFSSALPKLSTSHSPPMSAFSHFRSPKQYRPISDVVNSYVVLEPSSFSQAHASTPTLRFPSTALNSKAVINEAITKPASLSLPLVVPSMVPALQSRRNVAAHTRRNSSSSLSMQPLVRVETRLSLPEMEARESVKRIFVSSLLTGRCQIQTAKFGCGIAQGGAFHGKALKLSREHWAPVRSRRLHSPLRSAPSKAWAGQNVLYYSCNSRLPQTFTAKNTVLLGAK